MLSVTQYFVDSLIERGLKCIIEDTSDERNVVRLNFNGKNYAQISVFLYFSKEEKYAEIRCFGICRVSEEKRQEVLELLNTLNLKYRWLKFYIDTKGMVCSAADAMIGTDTVAQICTEYAMRSARIIDEAYPDLMKTQWSN
ncbi:MAG: YbjN domain-containing protein [Bacillota bacterium]|nr:YbjN domain-containing protein [Bacillota bacterium]